MPVAASCCREKAVLVTVYVEKPRRSISELNHHRRRLHQQQQNDHHRHHRHHYHHLHQPIKQRRLIHNTNSEGSYDRRAQLLQYSHDLRQSAHYQSSSIPLENLQEKKIIAIQPKRTNRINSPTCFGNVNWKKRILPNFLRSFLDHPTKRRKKKKHNSEPTTQKMKAIVKSIDRKLDITSKLLSMFRKRR